jgi:lipopolysaccharide export system permease protein
VAPGVFQTSRDGNRVFFIERERPDAINAKNVFILSNDGTRESVTSARAGHLETLDGERWLVLERGQRNEFDAADGEKLLSSFDTSSRSARPSRVRRAPPPPPI